jgi:hypothetical protein
MQSNNLPPNGFALTRRWCAVDPGHNMSAMAYSSDGRTLTDCRYVETPKVALGGVSTWSLVVEMPEIHDGQTRDPDSILKVRDAARTWELYVQWERVRRVRPNEWKGGSQKKPQNHKRVLKALSPDEFRIVEAALEMSGAAIWSKVEDACLRVAATGKVSRYSWSAHNVLDAVGILLFALGRL